MNLQDRVTSIVNDAITNNYRQPAAIFRILTEMLKDEKDLTREPEYYTQEVISKLASRSDLEHLIAECITPLLEFIAKKKGIEIVDTGIYFGTSVDDLSKETQRYIQNINIEFEKNDAFNTAEVDELISEFDKILGKFKLDFNYKYTVPSITINFIDEYGDDFSDREPPSNIIYTELCQYVSDVKKILKSIVNLKLLKETNYEYQSLRKVFEFATNQLDLNNVNIENFNKLLVVRDPVTVARKALKILLKETLGKKFGNIDEIFVNEFSNCVNIMFTLRPKTKIVDTIQWISSMFSNFKEPVRLEIVYRVVLE